ncbi:MAG TPA: enoyl-CoA hydratase/isomerase family protein [Caulobacteraceae bacterium]|nr:enoyl-CoA hydratase/isomerase family protein [Caulobacteraceae bacterium]
MSSIVTTERRGSHLIATMDDPSTRNAMTEGLLSGLEAVFDQAEADPDLHSLVLTGANGAFCAGADLKSVGSTENIGGRDPAWVSNHRGGQFFARLNALPVCVIALVDGPAMGGGFGMSCCADIVLATARAKFALSETSLGLIPAQIAPYVVGRLGLKQARKLALTGEMLTGQRAVDVGLVDITAGTTEDLQAPLADLLNKIRRCGPRANGVTKRLLQSLAPTPAAFIGAAADAFTGALRGPEGQEGVSAFIEKRKARWTES